VSHENEILSNIGSVGRVGFAVGECVEEEEESGYY